VILKKRFGKTGRFLIFTAKYKRVKPAELFIEKKLEERHAAGNFRKLKPANGLVDFCSNDYLGFARSPVFAGLIEEEISAAGFISNGSTGSRLLSGNSAYATDLENQIAEVHKSEAGLLFNSGYDANLGLFSSIPQRGDTIITDELIHASIIDGARLSHANRYTFLHNDLDSLEEKLKHAKGNIFVAVESVYSMDGDTPPLEKIIALTDKYSAHLIVDEAHAIGLYGTGIVNNLDLQERVFARIVTFGKALGCHGAIILGSSQLKQYLVNFARSFIYTTAPAFHQLAAIKMGYQMLAGAGIEAEHLKKNIILFKQEINVSRTFTLIKSDSAIQCILLNSNEHAADAALALQTAGLDVRPILSPTVKAGSERIRICLHSFNTFDEITLLTDTLNKFINA